MADIAINLHTVRTLDEPLTEILDRVAAAGFDGVQFAAPYWPDADDAGAIAARLDELGLTALPPHIGIGTLRENLSRVIPLFGTIGVSGAVVPRLAPEHFASGSAVDAAAADVTAVAEELGAWGWNLHYHNHDYEYVDLGGEWALERFIDRTSIGIELDVGWALAGGDDPAGRIRAIGDRLTHVHMKDIDVAENPGFREIGHGDVDMGRCAAAAREVGVPWLIYEHDDPEDPAVSLETGAAYLNGL